LVPEPDDSLSVKTVKSIFDMAARDMGCKKIAKTLNRDGSRTKEGEK
jgi:hypothetical protein